VNARSSTLVNVSLAILISQRVRWFLSDSNSNSFSIGEEPLLMESKRRFVLFTFASDASKLTAYFASALGRILMESKRHFVLFTFTSDASKLTAYFTSASGRIPFTFKSRPAHCYPTFTSDASTLTAYLAGLASVSTMTLKFPPLAMSTLCIMASRACNFELIKQ
jgi:hypothetical protein